MNPKSKLDAKKIALALGAEHLGRVTARSGHFGALQLVAEIQSRFQVPQGGGRPTDPHWTERRLVPLAPETLARLGQIAKRLHEERGIVIAPLQLAALLLEQATGQVDERGAEKLARERADPRKIA
jgi:NifB/MoaA-like Fe-S oxidoreductase